MNDLKNFVVYKSSAGSGKTYTLVREYIMLALSSPLYFRNILAITFTNKAANEMKQRVLTTLLNLSDPVKYAHTSAVKYLLGEIEKKAGMPAPAVSERAGMLLGNILHNYDDFSVRTIDSFVTRIIRTFAHDLHLPLDFTIELDDEVLIDEAVDRLVERIGMDEEITKILVEFALSKADDEKSWNIDKDLKSAGKQLFTEAAYPHLDKLKQLNPSHVLDAVRKIRQFRKEFSDSIAAAAGSAVLLIESRQLSLQDFYQSRSGIGAYLQKLASGKIEEPGSHALTTIREDKWFAKTANPLTVSAFAEIKPAVSGIIQEILRQLESGFSSYLLLGMAEVNLYQMGVLNALDSELDTLRSEKRVLHISEFNRRITDIIVREPVPFIYERTGEKYNHYLVDEFQDTSTLQWKNLLPLLNDSLSNGRFNLLVGDAKQAIYRFRNGQVVQFISLPSLPPGFERDVFGDAESAMTRNFRPEDLKINFRSLPNVIRFNNSFFEWMSARLDAFGEVYKEQHQDEVPGKTGGSVTISFHEESSGLTFDEWNLSEISSLVSLLTGEGGYALSDIAILTRSNDNANEVADHLASEGLDVVSSEALLLAASPAVNLVVSMLQHLHDPKDTVARAAVIRGVDLLHPEAPSTWQTDLNDVSDDQRFREALGRLGIPVNSRELLSLPLFDLCEELVRLFRLHEGKYDSYIQFFLEFVSRAVSSGDIQLQDLLELWEEKKDKLSVVVPEGINAVRVMTIHKAKGLEFPVVIWPFAAEAVKTKGQIWLEIDHPVLEQIPVTLMPVSEKLIAAGFDDAYSAERQLSVLDSANLIYVAFTRPVERLYVFTRHPLKNSSSTFNLPALLEGFLAEKSKDWTQTGNRFEFGSPGFGLPKSEKKKQQQEHFNGSFCSSSWQSRIRIASGAPEAWDVLQPGRILEWGSLVHEMIAKIHTKEDIVPVIDEMLQSGRIEKDQSDTLRLKLKALVSHPQLAGCFKYRSQTRSEAAILTPAGSVYRPDRLVFTENDVTILEFKTGLPADRHRKQVLEYAGRLEEMGYRVAVKLLVYLDDPVKVVTL